MYIQSHVYTKSYVIHIIITPACIHARIMHNTEIISKLIIEESGNQKVLQSIVWCTYSHLEVVEAVSVDPVKRTHELKSKVHHGGHILMQLPLLLLLCGRLQGRERGGRGEGEGRERGGRGEGEGRRRGRGGEGERQGWKEGDEEGGEPLTGPSPRPVAAMYVAPMVLIFSTLPLNLFFSRICADKTGHYL